ncbi:U1 small nuclear ribonucleoprotein 70 kDa-like [Phragmites australis]|uniref:U1 small nuclear ribonucleoprotein 70 kDa-like n=1 Tax=Phragmites australis TaxID=29695 RepID=UPI002D76A71F|nr:U1 small nuclear ribonucleoprotein 70 kDa-like [Phragmites australis]
MGDYGNAMMRDPDAGVQSRAKAHNRSNALQLKLIGQSHPTGLTSNLLKLFEPRPPLEYKPPVEKRKLPAYTGMAQFVPQFAEPGDPEYAPPVLKGETRAEKKARICQLKLDQGAVKVAEELQKYDQQSDPNATGDPYKTLFVARLSYETPEHRIKREFEAYGTIKGVWLVTDKETNKPRGYAFVEFVHTRDMKNAYEQADGRKVDNKRVLVDVERGRTVPNWRPRRLGGGLGSSRIGGEGADHKRGAREQQLAGRPRSEEPRRDDRHADRDQDKSHERRQGRDRDGRTRERSHDWTRDRESREQRHNHRDRDRTQDKDQERDRERDRGRDCHDRDKHRDHGREREHERSHDQHRDRGRDRDRDYKRAGHQRDRGHLHDSDAECGTGDPRHERNMADYGQEYGYNHYEQHKGHDTYSYGQDGHGYETERSKRHKHETERSK